MILFYTLLSLVYKSIIDWMEWFHSIKLDGELKMTKDDIQGFALIPFVLLGCIFHEELADLIGLLLNCLFAHLG